MDLKRENPRERTPRLLVVHQLHRDLAVEFVNEPVSLREDRVFVPLGDVHLHRLALRDHPALALGVNHHALAILPEDAAGLFAKEHGVVRRRGVNVALVAADRPLADPGEFLAAILDAGVVPRLLHLRAQLKVLHHAAAPDEKLIVSQLLRPRRGADDAAILDLPQRRIAIPAGEVLAIEQRFEPRLRCVGLSSE